jgi:hypothetical protein
VTFVLWAGVACSILATHTLAGRPAGEFSPDGYFPREGVNKLEAEIGAGGKRVFHSPDWGGYLTFRLWPRLQPYIDDRNELNGKALYQEFFAVADLRDGWEEVLEHRKFGYVFIEPDSALALVLRHHPKWRLLREDGESILFGRADS